METEDRALEFTKPWFDNSVRPIWDSFIDQIDARTVLEIGSFEGASICYLIDRLGRRHALDVHCIDTWAGSEEHRVGAHEESDMTEVEARFRRNVRHAMDKVPNRVTLNVHKSESFRALSTLIAAGKTEYFDFVYVDGSHEAADTIADAVLAFKLLKVGGMMVFDDYLWRVVPEAAANPLRTPKPVIDAFTTLYWSKLHIMVAPSAQVYLRKVAS